MNPEVIGSVKSNNDYVQLSATTNVYETCTTTIAEDPVDIKFRVMTPNIYEARTTTSTIVVARTPTSLYELDPFRKVSPRRYNPETTPVNE